MADGEGNPAAIGKTKQVTHRCHDHVLDRRALDDLCQRRSEILEDDDGGSAGILQLVLKLARGVQRIDVNAGVALAFRHTGKPFRFKQVQVFDVAPDSLKYWLRLPLLKMQIQSATDLNYFEGAVMKTGKSIEKEFIQGFDFFVEKKDNSSQKQEIDVLEIQITAERSEYNNEIRRISRELQTVEDELRTGNNNYARMSDYQKGAWQRESKTLESQIKTLERELDRKPSLHLLEG